MTIRLLRCVLLLSVLSLIVTLSLLSSSKTWKRRENLEMVSSIQITDIGKSSNHQVAVWQAEDPVRQASHFKPLVIDEPVVVHILAYQRTASTVIGNLLSNLDGHFFLYEPLDLTFSAMYGTDPGWNVPSDIFNDVHTGEIRPPDRDEVSAMRWTMEAIYRCKMADNWPTAFLLHPFWMEYKTRAMKKYKECIIDKRPRGKFVTTTTLQLCVKKLGTLCGGHFNGSSTRLQKCKNVLYREGRYTTDVDLTIVNRTGFIYTAQEIENFKDYFRCLKPFEQNICICARQHLDKECEKSNIRIIKTVRASMHIPAPYFKSFANFRLVHLFRDPRGTAKSRLNSEWSHGIYELNNFTRIAASYCKNVHSDYLIRQDLEQKFPGQIMQILSDDFMIHSMNYVEDMALLLGKNVTLMKEKMKFRLRWEGISAREFKEHNQKNLEGKNTTPGKSAHRTTSKRILQPENYPYYLKELDESFKKHNPPLSEPFKYTLDPHLASLRHLLGLGFVKKIPPMGQSRLQMWQHSLLWNEVKDIEFVCKEFFNDIPYKWS